MRKPQGYLVSTAPDGISEYDTFTCGHDQKIVIVPPRSDPSEMGGFCRICWSLICPRCVTKATCTPWEKQMEKMEARARFLQAASGL